MKMTGYIFNKAPTWLCYSIGITLSLLLSCHLFTWSFLQGHSRFFEIRDAPQHISGLLFYLNDKWRFPLAFTKNLNYPEGGNIILTDSIPLAAVIFKLFRHGLPAGFHYFGWWHLLAYILQGLAAVFLIRALGYYDLFSAFIAAAFSILMPELTVRYGHTSLLTQGLILFSMGIYVLGITRQRSLLSIWFFFNIVVILALLIHPYLFIMIFLIYIAFLGDYIFKNKDTTSVLKHLSVSILLILSIFLLFGYFNDMEGDKGYGFYSMNLLAPICNIKYSFCSPRGQYEGFNYLGMGVIALLVFVIAKDRHWLFSLPKQYPWATVLGIIFCIFSVSNKIYFGKYLLIDFYLPDFILDLFSIFRSSGRFFWPVGYTLLFLALVGMLRQPRRILVALMLSMALVWQYFDTEYLFKFQKLDLNQLPKFEYSNWANLTESISAIDVFPPYSKINANEELKSYFLLLAGTNHLLFNNAVLAHHKEPDKKDNMIYGSMLANHLYIIIPQPGISLPDQLLQSIQNNQCREFQQSGSKVLACMLNKSDQWWTEKAPWMRKTGSIVENS